MLKQLERYQHILLMAWHTCRGFIKKTGT